MDFRIFCSVLFFLAQSSQAADPIPPKLSVNTAMPSSIGATIQVNAGEDFQDALDKAFPGDEIILQSGATFAGNFRLRKKDNPFNRWIIIRTSNMTGIGSAGTRVSPAKAVSMPKIISPNTMPALAADASASYYRLVGIEATILPTVRLNYQVLEFGYGEETSVSQLPHHFIVDRCYVHGQPMSDVKRGIQLNVAHGAVIDSYVSDIHGLGLDSQAIGVRNGPGPFKIVNNHLEAAAENILFGGAEVYIPNLVPSDIEIRRNHLTKPLSWGKGILGTPTGLSVVSSTGGSLSATTRYYYRIVAQGPAGYSSTVTSPSSLEVSLIPGSGKNSVVVKWYALKYATKYIVYRSTDRTAWKSFSVGSALSFTDLGAAGTASSTPSSIGTRWTLKNLLEFKNSQRVIVDSNILENNWDASQDGFAILLTPRNAGADTPWVVVQDILFTNNIVRRSAAGIQILGIEYNNPPYYSQVTRRIKFKDNLMYDIGGSTWYGSGRMIDISGGISGSVAPVEVTFDHNTLGFSNTYSLILVGSGVNAPDFVFKNNIAHCGTYGIKGSSEGDDTLVANFPNVEFEKNALIGCESGRYQQGVNYLLTAISNIGFVQYTTDGAATNDYRLSSSSLYNNAGTDGLDLGANVTQVLTATISVTSGAASAATPTPTPAPTPSALKPFSGTPAAVPGRIEAENYDVGGLGIAYYDTTTGNEYGLSSYRDNSVDFRSCLDTSGCGFYVGRIEPGEWLKYTVKVSTARQYTLEFRVASEYTGKTLKVEIDGKAITGTVTVPNTGGWQAWKTVSVTVGLTAGTQVMKVISPTGGMNLNFISFR
jgi:hypothetical protein